MVKDENIPVRIKEFTLDQIPLSASLIVLGPPGTGKTNLIEAIAYYKRHRYPVGRCFMGTETGYERFGRIFGRLYVENEWNGDSVDKYIKRQRKKTVENPGKGVWSPGTPAILIADDASQDSKTFREPNFISLYKNGSQHWGSLTIVGTQVVMDFHTAIRSSVSFVFIGRYVGVDERRKLWKSFGGNIGTFDMFSSLMDQLTGDYHFMVIQILGATSTAVEDTVFYWKPPLIEDMLKKKGGDGYWKFGCKEFQEWGNSRMNPDWQETF